MAYPEAALTQYGLSSDYYTGNETEYYRVIRSRPHGAE